MSTKTKDAHFYAVARLSENIVETPEGYLLCLNVPIARTGSLTYMPGELVNSETGDDVIEPKDGKIIVERDAASLFDQRTMASFEGKSITVGHPSDFVSPDNYLTVTVGHMQNVRQGQDDDADKLVADLLIMESAAIAMVKAGLREVSLGYDADYEQIEPGMGRQTGIVGNHVALVRKGRNGSEVAVRDSAPENTPQTRSKTMKKSVLQGALMKLLGRAFDEMPEEIKEEAAADDSKTGDEDVNARLARVEEMLLKLCDVTGAADADPEAKPAEEKPAEAAPETPVVTDADPTAPATPTEGESDVGARLAAIEAALAKLLETKAAAAATDSAPLADAETLARAEILVPGIVNSGTLIKDALDQFGQTESGKKVLATLDSIPEEGSKFVAAAELVKSQRQGALALTVDSFAGLHRNDPKAMTPEKLNEANAKRWNQQ